MKKLVQFGLIKGGGTGDEIYEIFKALVGAFASKFDLEVKIKELEEVPNTYFELEKMELSPDQVNEIEEKEAQMMADFLFSIYEEGYNAVFRTAINAGTLYQLRRKIKSIKSMKLKTLDHDVLLIRDQAQGFYAIDSKKEDEEYITLECSYTKEFFNELIKFSHDEGSKNLQDDYRLLAIYKYHLFNKLQRWFRNYEDVELYQPDSGLDILMHQSSDVLVIASNEVGDTLTEYLPLYYRIGNKATMSAKNISLDSKTYGQEIYQTIHGSADNIAGKGIVNPFATIRATTDMFSSHIEHPIEIENILTMAQEQKYVTPDLGGNKKTSEVIDFVLKSIEEM